MRRAFELYATGEYSLRQLHRLLTDQGLTTRPTAKTPAGPPALSKFALMLRNRYYLGMVSYRGVQYHGKHEPLVGPELFARVQRILDERDQHHLKQRRHQHYLRGLMTCTRCGSRLLYTVVRGQAGGLFAYYVCGRRHRADGCDLPYLPADELEQRLERTWPLYVHLDQVDAPSSRRTTARRTDQRRGHPAGGRPPAHRASGPAGPSATKPSSPVSRSMSTGTRLPSVHPGARSAKRPATSRTSTNRRAPA